MRGHRRMSTNDWTQVTLLSLQAEQGNGKEIDMDTLGDALPKEMARVRDEVIPAYQHPALNGSGALAIMCMRNDLDAAARAMAEGDVIEMMRVYESLKGYHV